MPTPTLEQLSAIKAVDDAIVKAVIACGSTGFLYTTLLCTIYAALMSQGCSPESFMAALVRVGRLTKRSDCYFVA